MIKAYSSYFVSFLLDNLTKADNIKSIILFGSAARNEAAKESDIDLFIEVKKENKYFSAEINKILEKFYKSREALYFKTKGIDNKINVITGKLEKWKELKKSIENNGIILYGNYISSEIKGKKYAIIFWDNIGKNRGAFLNKIYGFKVKQKSYLGILKKLNGMKLGKSTIMMPMENLQEISKILKYYKVNAKIIEVYY